MLKFLSKAKRCTCQIFINDNNENLYGSGFFCKIPYTKNNNILLNVLLTCEHVLKKDVVFSSKNIKIKLDDKIKNISLSKERKKWSNEKMDYSCIEILDDDEIDDYYQLDDMIFQKDYSNNLYLDEKHIIIFGIMKTKRRGHSPGIIKYIQDHLFAHNCNTDPGCSGGAIVNKNNNCIIGLHRGEIIKKKKIINCGIFIKNIIDNIKLDAKPKIMIKLNIKDLYTLIFIGNCGIGTKTSLINAYLEGKGCGQKLFFSTLGFDPSLKVIQYLQKNLKLQLIDTCGQEYSIYWSNYTNIDCIILGYDITNNNSFKNIESIWIPRTKNKSKKFYLVGNKIDLEEEREVSKEEAIELANKYGFPFCEVSARYYINVKELFEDILNYIIFNESKFLYNN